MDIKLTKDSDRLICEIYKKYLEKIAENISKSEAKKLGSSKEIHSEIMPEWFFSDVDEICRELGRAGLLNCFYADNIVYSASISDVGIIYMENRFKNGIKDVVNFLSNFTSLI